MSLALYHHALKDLGLRETPGPMSTPRIHDAIKAAANWLAGDDGITAWCGCIRGLWGMETGTGVPPQHYRAASWLSWGEAVTLPEARRGDTVVISRQGGNHVALLDRVEGGHVYLLGGNQSNAVTIAPFIKSLVKGVRRAV